jgi:hypothetical protein
MWGVMEQTATNILVALDGEQCLFIEQYNGVLVNIKFNLKLYLTSNPIVCLKMISLLWNTKDLLKKEFVNVVFLFHYYVFLLSLSTKGLSLKSTENTANF